MREFEVRVEMLIIINDSPPGCESSLGAIRFCRAAIERGHRIRQVFFYADGIYQSIADPAAEGGSTALQKEWSELAKSGAVDLVVCAAARERRLGSMAPLPGTFRPGGLVETMALAAQVDRTVSFGGT